MMSDLLEHYGTKGMKWGVKKASKPIVKSRVGKNSRREGLGTAGRGVAALIAPVFAPTIASRGLGRRLDNNSALRKALDKPLKSYNRESLSQARRLMSKYSNVEISTDGKKWKTANTKVY